MKTCPIFADEIINVDFFKQIIKQRVSDGNRVTILSENESANYTLILVLPQLGDFDSLEYAWWLNRERDFFLENNIIVKAVGIGNRQSGEKFCQYTHFPAENLFVDSSATLHQQLNLYEGLNWRLPFVSPSQNAWFNLLLMCAGIGSQGTLKEVFRGYKGDRNAPALFTDDTEIDLKPFPKVKGSLFNKVGKNYQRPFELATLRLQNMVEVIKHWRIYVPDDQYITYRGATFLFDRFGKLIYQHRDKNILGFAENMSNPLHFLREIICKK